MTAHDNSYDKNKLMFICICKISSLYLPWSSARRTFPCTEFLHVVTLSLEVPLGESGPHRNSTLPPTSSSFSSGMPVPYKHEIQMILKHYLHKLP